MRLNNKILSDITVHMKYAKYIPELNRRETWEELVTRNKGMHLKSYPDLKEEIEEVYNMSTKAHMITIHVLATIVFVSGLLISCRKG